MNRRVWISLFFVHTVITQNAGNECQPPILGHWENMTVTEGGTAIFRCPMDAVKSCIAQKVEWFRVNSEGTSEPLKNPRVEVFAFDPLLMYMTDTILTDEGWYTCNAINSKGSKEAKVYLKILKNPLLHTTTETTAIVDEKVPEVPEVPEVPKVPEVRDRNVDLQMAGNSVLTPVTDTPPEITTTASTTPRSNKWARFQVYSKYRGSRVSYPGAGFGAAFSKALAADNVTLIPRREEDMLPRRTTTSTTPNPYWIITTTKRPRAPATTTPDPRFVLYNNLKNESPHIKITETNSVPDLQAPEAITTVWNRGGKDALPKVAADLSNRDHLEAIHDHLRYIYDRLDDLLDRIHLLEMRQRG